MIKHLCPLMLVLLLGACNMFAPEASQQTLQADRDTRATEIAVARTTATVSADRLNRTQEFAETSVARAGVQATRMSATLFASGIIVDQRLITPAVVPTEAANVAGNADTSNSNNGGFTAVEPIIIGQGSAQGNSGLSEPPTATPLVTSTPDPTQPSLTSLTLTDQVGADDCAANSLTTFPQTTSSVYIVATANNLTPQNVVTARFSREGVEQVFYTWSPGAEVNDACIWFNMPASSVDFAEGNWQVALDIDGTPAGDPVAFRVGEIIPTQIIENGAMAEPTSAG